MSDFIILFVSVVFIIGALFLAGYLLFYAIVVIMWLIQLFGFGTLALILGDPDKTESSGKGGRRSLTKKEKLAQAAAGEAAKEMKRKLHLKIAPPQIPESTAGKPPEPTIKWMGHKCNFTLVVDDRSLSKKEKAAMKRLRKKDESADE